MFALSFFLLLKLTQTCPFPPSVLTLSWLAYFVFRVNDVVFPKGDDRHFSQEAQSHWEYGLVVGAGVGDGDRDPWPETLKQGWGLRTNSRVDSKALSQDQVVRLEWGQAEDWGPELAAPRKSAESQERGQGGWERVGSVARVITNFPTLIWGLL